MKRRVCTAVFLLTGMMGSSSAWALSCDEIMNMVNVNVPTSIVVQTIKDSGDQFAADEISCLESSGAPGEIIDQARSQSLSSTPERVPEPEPEERRPSMDDDEDVIGSRNDRSGDDLPEEGSSDSPDPERIKEAIKLLRAKKPLTASLILYEMLEEGAYPDQETKIHYYLARALGELEMYHTAQYHYMQVIKKGPSNPYFNYALPKLVSIARFTGDDTELMRIVARVPPDAFPRSAKNHLNYLLGVRYYSKDELSRARESFGQVSSKSSVYLRARYFEGVIYNEQGKLKSAVRAFRDVYREEVEVYNDPEDLREVEVLKDLALINVARIYYGIERYDEAAKYYALVSRTSEYWAESLFEASWSNFMQNDLNSSLGQILTVDSPFFTEDQFIPEATILKSLTFFNLCEYSEVESMLLGFEDEYRPMQEEMRSFVQDYSSPEGRELADQAWRRYFGTEQRTDSLLPKSLFNRILRNQDLAGIVRHMQMMDAELDLIDQQKSRWQESVGVYLKKIIEADRERYERRAGKLFLSEMARNANYISDLLTQSEIIRFEVVDAQRVDYSYRAQNMDLLDSSQTVDIDFATAVDFIYWPFNGEFWEDELGYYKYTEQGSCQ